MKTSQAILLFAIATVAKSGEPDAATILSEVRPIISAPDQWADMSQGVDTLAALAKRCKEKNKDAVESFGQSLASYRAFFADHRFAMSTDERIALSGIILAYEARFASERACILASWREHPDQDRGCLESSALALFPADFELERCASLFAGHNTNKSRPNELAGVYIEVVRIYGRLMASLAPEPIPSATDNSGATPRRG
ncbi:MAG: hypothetical protein HZA32_04395 [Opitutae bacterium]|nr:hypothetical protein [Opitutae bacterium]